VAQARFPLETPGAAKAREAADALRTQLDDYLIPRVARLDAPLLAVVGGSTGAGKSTLVNSLVRAPVSRSGVLRPTTRGPVLVCHPADGGWFSAATVLPTMPRTGEPSEGALAVVSAPKLAPGLALLDSPDIDSVVAPNRELADELLAAADLWLFVTTATRYADAVPWSVLRGARDRGTVVAVVLDRVPPGVRDEVAADLGRLLSEHGLPGAPLFVVDESTLDPHGLLPVDQIAPIETYLSQVATNDVRRRGVARRTVLGALAAATATADELAWAIAEQCTAADALTDAARATYQRVLSAVEQQIRTGAALRGTAYERWRECVASGEVRRSLKAAVDPSRARPAHGGSGRALHTAIASNLAALLVEAETLAADEIADRWRDDPAGRSLIEEPGCHELADPDLARDAARNLIRDWSAWLQQEARVAAPHVRSRTRGSATSSVVLLATVAAVASVDATDIDDLRATARVARLAERARAELLTRIEEHLAASARRWREPVAQLDLDRGLVARLRSAAAEVGVARQLAPGLGRAA
jgi:hypothetical protein